MNYSITTIFLMNQPKSVSIQLREVLAIQKGLSTFPPHQRSFWCYLTTRFLVRESAGCLATYFEILLRTFARCSDMEWGSSSPVTFRGHRLVQVDLIDLCLKTLGEVIHSTNNSSEIRDHLMTGDKNITVQQDFVTLGDNGDLVEGV